MRVCSINISVIADGEAEDADGAAIGRIEDHGRIFGIIGNELYAIFHMIDMLEGSGIIDDDSGDLAIHHIILGTEKHDITIEEAGFHGIAGDAQGKIASGSSAIDNIGIIFFIGIDGLASSDGAEQGNLSPADGEDIFGKNRL